MFNDVYMYICIDVYIYILMHRFDFEKGDVEAGSLGARFAGCVHFTGEVW